MKIELNIKLVFDLDDLIRRFSNNPVLAIKDCVKQELYIRKLNDNFCNRGYQDSQENGKTP